MKVKEIITTQRSLKCHSRVTHFFQQKKKMKKKFKKKKFKTNFFSKKNYQKNFQNKIFWNLVQKKTPNPGTKIKMSEPWWHPLANSNISKFYMICVKNVSKWKTWLRTLDEIKITDRHQTIYNWAYFIFFLTKTHQKH